MQSIASLDFTINDWSLFNIQVKVSSCIYFLQNNKVKKLLTLLNDIADKHIFVLEKYFLHWLTVEIWVIWHYMIILFACFCSRIKMIQVIVAALMALGQLLNCKTKLSWYLMPHCEKKAKCRNHLCGCQPVYFTKFATFQLTFKHLTKGPWKCILSESFHW